MLTSLAVHVTAIAVVVASVVPVPSLLPAVDPPPMVDPPAAVSDFEGGRWRLPVQGEISDFFRPPSTPYGPGNRGLEFAVADGSPIVAVAAGTVSFAGQVGASFHVVVDHSDGLRSGYSYLSQVDVMAGDLVDSGEVLGASSNRFHLSARLADGYAGEPIPSWGARRYVDPLPLLGLVLIVRLVANP